MQAIFDRSCGGCHGAADPAAALDLVSAGLRDRLSGRPSSACDGKIVAVAGDPTSSYLRRLYKKHPYFTNGSASSVDEVLDRVRVDPDGRVWHQGGGGGGQPLGIADRRALSAFLQLL